MSNFWSGSGFQVGVLPGSGTRTIVRDRAGSGVITQQLGTEQESKLQQVHRIQRLVMPPVHTIQRLETRTIVRVNIRGVFVNLFLLLSYFMLTLGIMWDRCCLVSK